MEQQEQGRRELPNGIHESAAGINLELSGFEEAFESLTAHGWLAKDEASILWAYASVCTGAIIEVGSYCGRSSRLLAHFHRPLYCIDPWDDEFSDTMRGGEAFIRFKKSTGEFPHVIPIHSKVEQVKPFRADLVFLDGDHTYEGTVNQIIFATQCNPRFIAVHDISNGGGGRAIKRAAIELLGPTWHSLVGTLATWRMR